jgi:hypothetical protein
LIMKQDKDKRKLKSGKNKTSIVRLSAAEYLTFVAASGKGGVEAVYADENIWLTQKMMGVLYDVETHTINYHLKKVFADSELEEDSRAQQKYRPRYRAKTKQFSLSIYDS